MKYRVTERQVIVYTWVVDSEDLDGEDLEDALQAGNGVPDDATVVTFESETTHEEVAA